MNDTLAKYGITLTGTWNPNHTYAVFMAAILIGNKLAEKGGTSVSAFRAAYSGGVNITFGSGNHPSAGGDCATVTSGGCTTSSHQIDFWTMAGDNDSYGNETTRDLYNVVHELGHAYDKGNNLPSQTMTEAFAAQRDLYLRPNGYYYNGAFVEDKGYLNIQQDTLTTRTEAYGDMYVAWVFNAWNTNPDFAGYVSQAQGYMPH
jgi:hypothetical protein